MRIGFDGKRVFHNFRGLGNYSRTLIESLTKYYPDQEYILYTPPLKDERALAWKSRFPNIEVRTPESKLSQKFSSAWRSLFLTQSLKRDGLDLYHGLSHELPPGISRQKFKSIVTIHDLIFLRFPEFFPWIDRQVYLRKFTYAVQNADLVVAICEQTKEDIIDYLKVPEEKTRVIYQSCNPLFYVKAQENKKDFVLQKYNLSEHYILYVGAIEQRKNALSLVEAFARIKDKVAQDLVLVGRGKEYKQKIEKAVAAHGMSDRVILTDSVSDEELPIFYQNADLFVYPSFFEGWGIPNVEALFSGVPVITSEGSCFWESAGPNSLYVDPYSVEDIADKMEMAISDKCLREKMINEGRNYAEKFHWKNTSKNLMDVYQELR